MRFRTKCISRGASSYQGSLVESPPSVRMIPRGRAYLVKRTQRYPKDEVRGRIKAKVG